MTYPLPVTSGNSNELGSPAFRVLLYSRVSSQHQVQTGHSLDAQPEALSAWAESNGWRVVGEISDPGRTGRNTQRQGFNDLMKAIHSFRPDAVVVTRLSRFMRNARLTLNAVHEMPALPLMPSMKCVNWEWL
jgi:DNA invertase Pin-like site-specific DNA recombinase